MKMAGYDGTRTAKNRVAAHRDLAFAPTEGLRISGVASFEGRESVFGN
ncbi:MAG: hypothetical protein R3E68_21765 [Burkholderiaceae bacterium]